MNVHLRRLVSGAFLGTVHSALSLQTEPFGLPSVVTPYAGNVEPCVKLFTQSLGKIARSA